MVLCETKNGSSMASLWRTFWNTFIFESVAQEKDYKNTSEYRGGRLPVRFKPVGIGDVIKKGKGN